MAERFTGIRFNNMKVIVTDPETFYSAYVPEGEKWYIESVAAFNDTTDNTECLVGIDTLRDEYPITLFEDLTVDLFDSEPIRSWLFPGERLYFKWSGVGVGDVVEFSVVGHRKID